MAVATLGGTPKTLAAEMIRFARQRHDSINRFLRIHNPSPPFHMELKIKDGDEPRMAGDKIVIECWPRRVTQVVFFALADDGAPRLLTIDKTTKMVGGTRRVTATTTMPKSPGGLRIKAFAFDRRVDVTGVRTADQLFQAMQRVFGDTGQKQLLSTNGWASQSVWVPLLER